MTACTPVDDDQSQSCVVSAVAGEALDKPVKLGRLSPGSSACGALSQSCVAVDDDPYMTACTPVDDDQSQSCVVSAVAGEALDEPVKALERRPWQVPDDVPARMWKLWDRALLKDISVAHLEASVEDVGGAPETQGFYVVEAWHDAVRRKRGRGKTWQPSSGCEAMDEWLAQKRSKLERNEIEQNELAEVLKWKPRRKNRAAAGASAKGAEVAKPRRSVRAPKLPRRGPVKSLGCFF